MLLPGQGLGVTGAADLGEQILKCGDTVKDKTVQVFSTFEKVGL
jgi:hypothetical protein